MDGPFSLHTRLAPRPRWISQVPRCLLFHSCHALRPRRGLQQPSPFNRLPTIAFQVFDLVGPRSCNEALSLHLRYGPNVALSTLSPCRYLHAPKTRFLVSWLCSFQGRELHPLKAPGFSWRTKELRQINIYAPYVTFSDIVSRPLHCIVSLTARTKSITRL